MNKILENKSYEIIFDSMYERSSHLGMKPYFPEPRPNST